MINIFDIVLEGPIYLKSPETDVGHAIKVNISSLEKEDVLKIKAFLNEKFIILIETDYSVTYLGPCYTSILKVDYSAQTPSNRRRLEDMAKTSFREGIAKQLQALLKEEK